MRVLLALLLFASALVAGPAHAAEPLWRWVGVDDGLVDQRISALTQGPRGLLWLGTRAGVWRWDGQQAVRWDGGVLRQEVTRVVVRDDETVWARTRDGHIWRVDGRGAHQARYGDARPVLARDLAILDDGSLVALRADGLVSRQTDGRWSRWTTLDLGDQVYRIWPGRGGGELLIGGYNGLSWWRPGSAPRRLLDAVSAVCDVARSPDGSLWAGTWTGVVYRIPPEPDGEVEVIGDDLRTMGMVARGDTVWVSHGRKLVQYGLDGTIQSWGPDQGVRLGGPLIVDREGSLWAATHEGLGLLAEPNALRWTWRDGLPGLHARFLARVGDRVLAKFWGRPSLIELFRDGEPPEIRAIEGSHASEVCATEGGIAWGVHGHEEGGASFMRLDGLGFELRPAPDTVSFWETCASGPDDSVWLTAKDALYRTDGSDWPRRVTPLPFERPVVTEPKRLYVSDDDTVYVTASGVVCEAGASRLRGGEADWDCSDPGIGRIRDLLQDADTGEPWAVSGQGIRVRRRGVWVEPPGARELASDDLISLTPSPRGGFWIAGAGTLVRVRSAPGSAAGWVVRERLADWVGPLVDNPMDVLDTADGELWVLGPNLVVRIPPSSRGRTAEAPPLNRVLAEIDGTSTEGEHLVLPSPSSRVRLRFAAASYRSPRSLRYRMRLDDGPWSSPTVDASYEFSALGPGEHAIDVAASLDGVHWTQPPARTRVTVPVPWYHHTLLWVLCGGVLVVGSGAVYRIRMNLALREERLRTRIAMDLHDEVGAGLGAIRMMVDLLARGGLPDSAREELNRRVASKASTLTGALRSIVWSLRPQSKTLAALAQHLEARARSAHPALDAAGRLTLEHDLPPHPVRLDLEVVRAVQLVVTEALNNVAKHAEAEHVTLRLASRGPDRWRWSVIDDGRGLPAELGDGLGMLSMQRRADEIGARLTIRPGAEGGTEVHLTFTTHRPWWRTPEPR